MSTKTRQAAGPRRDPKTETWWFVVDAAPAPAQRCTACRHRVWVEGSRTVPTCPKCAAPMAPAVPERRQVKRRGFATKKAAQVEFDRLKVSVHDSTFVPNQTATVAEYLRAWVDALPATGRRPNTVHSYSRQLELHVIPTIGAIGLQQLSPLDLDQLYARLLRAGRKKGSGGGLSNRTVLYVHTIIGRALEDARRKGLVVRNVAKSASPPSRKSTAPAEMTVWTPEQLRAFLTVTADHDLAALFRFAAMTGMRRGEVLGLRWSDLDLDAGKAMVRQQLVRVDGEASIAPVKTDASRRTVDLDERTVAVLRAHRAEQLRNRLAVGAGYADLGLVFARPDGHWLAPATVSRWFASAVAAAGLTPIRFHDLRHTMATHWLAAGRSPRVVSERLGHTSVAFTLDRYTHLLPTTQADGAEAVAAMVDG